MLLAWETLFDLYTRENAPVIEWPAERRSWRQECTSLAWPAGLVIPRLTLPDLSILEVGLLI